MDGPAWRRGKGGGGGGGGARPASPRRAPEEVLGPAGVITGGRNPLFLPGIGTPLGRNGSSGIAGGKSSISEKYEPLLFLGGPRCLNGFDAKGSGRSVIKVLTVSPGSAGPRRGGGSSKQVLANVVKFSFTAHIH